MKRKIQGQQFVKLAVNTPEWCGKTKKLFCCLARYMKVCWIGTFGRIAYHHQYITEKDFSWYEYSIWS